MFQTALDAGVFEDLDLYAAITDILELHDLAISVQIVGPDIDTVTDLDAT